VDVELLGKGNIDGPECSLSYDPYVAPVPPPPPLPPQVEPVYCSRDLMNNVTMYD
jgi:hypothetical protein